MNKIHIKKGSVQETLIIPLYENHRNASIHAIVCRLYSIVTSSR